MEKMIEIPDYELKAPYYIAGERWTSMHNFIADEGNPNKPDSIQLYDVTLRDGEQTPGVTFRADERYRIAQALSDMGVPRIEAGMPCVSAEVRQAIGQMVKANLATKIYSFNRAKKEDIDMSLELDVDGVVIEYSVNPYFDKYVYGMTADRMLETLISTINYAKEQSPNKPVVFMGWDWFRAPLAWTEYIIDNLNEYAKLDGVIIVDTIGSATPDAVYAMVQHFVNRYPRLGFEFHGHNDIGMGNANSLFAAYAGAKVIHTAMCGLGERVGNVATEEMATIFKCQKEIETGIDLSKIDATAQLISDISKVPIYPNKPIIGTRPYLMESGIGTDVEFKLSRTHNLKPNGISVAPWVIGRTELKDGFQYVLGKNSGGSSIRLFLDKYGIEATRDEVKKITDRVKQEGLVTKALVSERVFLSIVNDVKNGK